MENDNTKVSVTLGYTLNLGNFQSLRLDLGVVESIDPFRKNLAVIVELAAPNYGGGFQQCENYVLLNENVPARSWDHAHVMSSIRLVDHT